MSFLAPWALALAAAVAAPLAVHLLRRGPRRRVEFPALRHLRSAERSGARSLRVRDRWLLAARAGIVVLIAAVAAGPLVGRGAATDHGPTDVVLLLDNTASAARLHGETTLLDAQRERAGRSLRAARPGDRFWVLPAVGPAAGEDVRAEEAAAALDRVEQTDAAMDADGAVRAAADAAPPRPGRLRELQLFSDLQASSLPTRPIDTDRWDAVLVSAIAPEEGSNAAVTGLSLRPHGEGGDLVAHTGAWGDAPDSLDLRLAVDGRAVAVRRVAAGVDAIFPLPETAAGLHVVRVEIEPSGLRADDSRSAGWRVGSPPVVRLPGEGPGFLRRALDALAASGAIRPAGAAGAPADVEMIEDVERGRVPSRAASAAVVLVPPTDPAVLPAFDGALRALGVPWTLEMEADGGALRFGPASSARVPGLGSARIDRRYGVRRLPLPGDPSDTVLLRTSDGAPWLLRARTAGRVVLLLASPLDATSSNLPTSVAMVPFVEALVGWARPGADALPSADAGRPFVLPARADSVIDPHGRSTAVEGGAPLVPLVAGVWRVEGSGPGLPVALGVGVPPAESDPSVLAPAEAGRRLGHGVRVVTDDAEWAETVFAVRRGRGVSGWLLAAAVGLLVMEGVIAAPRRRRTAAP